MSDLSPHAPSEEDVRAAYRPVLWFSLLLLAGLWLTVFNPPWPMPLLSGVLAVAAIVCGVIGLVRLRRARTGGMMPVLVLLGILLAAGMVLLTSVQALMWPVYADFYACMDRALTHRAERECFAGLEQTARSQLLEILRPSAP
ncbi:MAG TPA: hypothetical protein VK046_09420 [Actinomycetaceae bacterium]|nr:hypothetical protein [Actinomycetaceae bacterium]